MVASRDLLNLDLAFAIGTLLCRVPDQRQTCIVLGFAIALLAPVVLLARLSFVHRLIMCSADEEVAYLATKDVATIVDLARAATWAQTVTKVGQVTEDADRGESVVPVRL